MVPSAPKQPDYQMPQKDQYDIGNYLGPRITPMARDVWLGA